MGSLEYLALGKTSIRPSTAADMGKNRVVSKTAAHL